MRTTITLDEDVAALLRQLRARAGSSLKALINEALRLGIERMRRPERRRAAARTRPIDGGRCLLGSLDNVAEVLSVIEGEARR